MCLGWSKWTIINSCCISCIRERVGADIEFLSSSSESSIGVVELVGVDVHQPSAKDWSHVLILLGFQAHLKAKAIWIGIVAGALVQGIMLAIIKCFTDWEKEVGYVLN